MDNNITYIESEYDEFNTLPVSNFYAQKIKGDTGIIVFKGFECLYPFFDYIISIEQPEGLINMSFEERAVYLNDISNIKESFILKTHLECVIDNHPNKQIYKFLFGKFTEYLMEKKIHMFNAPYSDVMYVKTKLISIDKPIVCINGRNLNKHTFRNELFINLIRYLIANGIFVINCTLKSPKFIFESSSYLELNEKELSSYNRTLAYFECSDFVLSIGNAGGISTLLMTSANIIMLGKGGWVDNNEFGYNGESMLSARHKFLPYKTIHINNFNNNFNKIIEIIKNE